MSKRQEYNQLANGEDIEQMKNQEATLQNDLNNEKSKTGETKLTMLPGSIYKVCSKHRIKTVL